MLPFPGEMAEVSHPKVSWPRGGIVFSPPGREGVLQQAECFNLWGTLIKRKRRYCEHIIFFSLKKQENNKKTPPTEVVWGLLFYLSLCSKNVLTAEPKWLKMMSVPPVFYAWQKGTLPQLAWQAKDGRAKCLKAALWEKAMKLATCTENIMSVGLLRNLLCCVEVKDNKKDSRSSLLKNNLED